jgi:hypothetical protein
LVEGAAAPLDEVANCLNEVTHGLEHSDLLHWELDGYGFLARKISQFSQL